MAVAPMSFAGGDDLNLEDRPVAADSMAEKGRSVSRWIEGKMPLPL
jgi:hypothetical protein